MLTKIRFVSSRHLFHRSGIFSRTLLVLVMVCAVTIIPRVALPELRPIIRDMLENLGEIDDIGSGLALDDFGRVGAAARSLQSRASAMKVHGEAPPGLDKQYAPAWDNFLTAQETTALAVLTAANEENGDAVMRGVEAMFRDSCLACHAVFREPQQRLSGSVLFMSSFLAAWRDINRGLSLRDFALIGRRARELEAMAKTLSWDQVIQSAFAIDSTADLQIFRQLVHQVAVNSSRIEAAAQSEDAGKVVEATRQLWTNGCIACHDRFR
jgi:cytochrome c556